MTDFERSVINLIKSGLTGEKCEVDSNIDLDALYSFALNHHVALLVYYGLLKSEIPISEELKLKFKSLSYKYIYISNNQLYEIMRIAQEFEKADIVYQLLKGAVLKQLYPHPEMRYMSDADILIKTSQYDKIIKVMENLGFEFKYESDHELVWSKKNCLTVELHKRLIPSYNPDMYLYYGEGWRIFDKNSPKSVYTDENQFVYMFTHLAKHYRDGGAGIKYIIDLYVYRKAKPELDFTYIVKQFEILGINQFYDNICRLIDVWFSDGQSDEITDLLTKKIFDSGAYGKFENRVISGEYKKTLGIDKNKNIALGTFFPSLETMAKLYPVLKSTAVLLPFMWVYRWFDVLFTRKKNIKKAMHKIEVSTRKNINNYKSDLNKVGLDFEKKSSIFTFENCALLDLISNSLFSSGRALSKEADLSSVYKESCLQAVSVIAFDGMLKAGISNEDIEKYKCISQTALIKNIQIQNAHGVLHNLLTENNIPYCILKGCASAYYYPKPEYRSMGDIDFIVPSECFDKAEAVLLENGFKKIEIDCELHTVFAKGSFRYELHRSIKGIPDGDKQEIIENYISQIVKTSVDANCKGIIFEKPEHFYHGLIMLLHTYEHILSEGIGLRHLCDWAVFVNSFSSEEFKSIFEEKLKNVGLWEFARILSATSVDFLGMPYKEWIGEINSEITYALIEDIFIGGNFGRKSKTRTDEGMMISKGKEQHYIHSFIKSINKIVIHKWPVADKIKILILFGWFFFGGRYCLRMIFGKRRKLISKENINNAARRQNLYSKFKLFETE